MKNRKTNIIAVLAAALIFTAACLTLYSCKSGGAAQSGDFTVTMSVRCDSLVNDIDALNREKHDLVPPDGILFYDDAVSAYEGDSLFDILQRELSSARIHMEASAGYVMGIGNIYESDAGDLSGWLFKVNGSFSDVGSAQHIVQPNDTIEWFFTTDFLAEWEM